jgi:hypothetical protein
MNICHAGSVERLAKPDAVLGSPEPSGPGMRYAICTPDFVTKNERSSSSITVTSDPVTAWRITAEVFPFAMVTVTDPAMDGFPTTWQNQ